MEKESQVCSRNAICDFRTFSELSRGRSRGKEHGGLDKDGHVVLMLKEGRLLVRDDTIVDTYKREVDQG
jgi:hypothetical protein